MPCPPRARRAGRSASVDPRPPSPAAAGPVAPPALALSSPANVAFFVYHQNKSPHGVCESCANHDTMPSSMPTSWPPKGLRASSDFTTRSRSPPSGSPRFGPTRSPRLFQLNLFPAPTHRLVLTTTYTFFPHRNQPAHPPFPSSPYSPTSLPDTETTSDGRAQRLQLNVLVEFRVAEGRW